MFQETANSLRTLMRHEDIETQNVGTANRPLLVGIRTLASFFVATFCLLPGFVLDIQPGLKLSRLFANIGYLLLTLGSSFGLIICRSLSENLIGSILPGMPEKTVQFISTIPMICIVIFGVLAITITIWTVYHREEIERIVLYSCSSIMLPETFQIRTAVRIFCATYILMYFSDPACHFLVVGASLEETDLVNRLPTVQFKALKFTAKTLILTGTTCLNVCEMFVPVLTCYMACCLAKHLDIRLKYLLGHHRSNQQQNLGIKSCQQISDHSLDTLHTSWPLLSKQDYPQLSSLDSHEHHTNAILFDDVIFTYKNILRTLSEIKVVVDDFERVFGWIHSMQIYASGFRVATWTGLFLLRQRIKLNVSDEAGQLSSGGSGMSLAAGLIGIAFAAETTLIFLYCDQLRYQMRKLRDRLFHINLSTVSSDNLAKVDMIWTLYDQVERLSYEANFRLTPNTFYSKRLLVKLFSQIMSFILLFLQTVDIFNSIY